MINDEGGVNGRKINFIQYDDAYSPPKTVEQVRKLVESDEVLLTFQLIGTPSNAAVQKYLNAKKVPQLFAATGASRFTDPKNFPWTMGYNPNYRDRGPDLRADISCKKYPERQDRHPVPERRSRHAITSTGLKDGLGDKAETMIVAETSYELSDPTIDSQIVQDEVGSAPTSCSTPRRRNSPPRRSRRSPTSTGSRCTSSTSTPPRSAR